MTALPPMEYPGVEGHVHPLSDRQAAALRRQGWTDVDDTPPPFAPDADGPVDDDPEEY